MADATVDQVGRYILDGSDDDLRRLLSLSESFAEHARRALRRVGVGPGWTVIDCGCGPIGGLAILAEMVGPAGRVVGVDFSEPAIQRARSVVAALQLGNVELFAGDIHELDAAAVGGPFDLAYTRFFLMHQPDPVRTLSQIARLLRPGGWVVAQEALRSPPPTWTGTSTVARNARASARLSPRPKARYGVTPLATFAKWAKRLLSDLGLKAVSSGGVRGLAEPSPRPRTFR